MQHFGDPEKQPQDQEDLISRIREMEKLAGQIEPELDLEHKNELFQPGSRAMRLWMLRSKGF